MRHFLVAVLLSFAALPAAAANVDWPRLQASLRNFTQDPSAAHAHAVSALLPASEHCNFDGSNEQTHALEQLEAALPALTAKVRAHHAYAVALAFRLYSVTDGDLSESLDIILGSLIRLDPALFLQSLSAHPEQAPFGLGGLLGNLGPSFVDRLDAQCRELRLRLKSLSSVSVPALVTTRDVCASELRRQVASTCGTATPGS